MEAHSSLRYALGRPSGEFRHYVLNTRLDGGMCHAKRENKNMANGPLDYSGSFDDHIDAFCESLRKQLLKSQKSFVYDSLRLPKKASFELAEILAGFAEDLHCDIGIWTAYERLNRQMFGTPLPLHVSPTNAQAGDPSLYLRLQHLLWVLYPQLLPKRLLAPNHADMAHLALALRQRRRRSQDRRQTREDGATADSSRRQD